MSGPIQNAKNVLVSQNPGTLPNMSDAILNWFQAMTFTTIVKTVVNFVVVETPTNVTFQGVWQPFTTQQLVMKPIGQRDWKWFTVHAQISLALSPDDVITYQGTQYRVVEKLDYSSYGYFEYHLVQDFTGSGP